MKFLIAGLGSIGHRHLMNLKALGEKDVILYRTGQGTLSDEGLEGFPVFSDLNQALDQKPDGVIIANPTSLHMKVAVPAAEAGCFIFLEKPIASHTEDLSEFENLVSRNPDKVFTGFQFRFNPGLQWIRNMLVSGDFGRALSFQCHWGEYLPDWHTWEDYRKSYSARSDLGGGVVKTLCHPLDYLPWLFGDVKLLFASVQKTGSIEIDAEDGAEVVFEFCKGLAGSLHLDYYRKPMRHDLEITTSTSVLQWDHASSDVAALLHDGFAIAHKAPAGYERNQMFLDEMSHFIDMVKNGVQPVCGYEDGKRALLLAQSILQSGYYHQPVRFG
jgi:predicted dehydrogenase